MKRLILPVFLIFALSDLSAQIPDSVSLNPSYTNQVYYSMENGTVVNTSNKDWDLQISVNAFSASIRLNSGEGVELYAPANQDTSIANWMNLDTANMTQLYDSDTGWEEGAFLAQATGHPDYGWGMYQGQGTLVGTKIFVVKSTGGIYFKFMVENLMNGITYNLKYESLDGLAKETSSLKKTDYLTKSFFYQDLDNNSVMDFEPADSTWDILFRRYAVELAPGVYYNVVGVLSNYGVTTAEARGVEIGSASYGNFPFVTNISNIGHDWKEFNLDSFKWFIEDSLSYFVSDRNDKIRKLVFTKYGGSSNGKIWFNQTEINTTSVERLESSNLRNLGIYPNPSSGTVNLLFNIHEDSDMHLNIYDLQGKVVYQKQIKAHAGLNNYLLSDLDLPDGQFIVTLNDGHNMLSHSLILVR